MDRVVALAVLSGLALILSLYVDSQRQLALPPEAEAGGAAALTAQERADLARLRRDVNRLEREVKLQWEWCGKPLQNYLRAAGELPDGGPPLRLRRVPGVTVDEVRRAVEGAQEDTPDGGQTP